MGRTRRRTADRESSAGVPAHRRRGGRLSRRRGPAYLAGAIDSHCHLQHERFDADREAVVERAHAAGLERLMVPGWDLRSSEAALALADRYSGTVQAAVGVHPHHAAEMGEAEWTALESLARDRRCVAIGEIGLDYHRNLSPPDVQGDALDRQLRLASDLDRPVLVHDRDAHDAVTSALLSWTGRPGRPVRGVLHAFSGDDRMAMDLTASGFVVSFALPLTFRTAVGPRAAAVSIGEDDYLVETDSPYLGPERDARNEPTRALRVIGEVARLRNVDPETAGAAVRRTYDRLLVP